MKTETDIPVTCYSIYSAHHILNKLFMVSPVFRVKLSLNSIENRDIFRSDHAFTLKNHYFRKRSQYMFLLQKIFKCNI